MEGPATVSAPELAALLDERAAGERDFLLVDVREPGEHEIVAIPGAVLAPRGAVLSGEIILPMDIEIILHCKSGGRSAEVLRFLRSEGYPEVRHLEGGILAWIHEVDRDASCLLRPRIRAFSCGVPNSGKNCA